MTTDRSDEVRSVHSRLLLGVLAPVKEGLRQEHCPVPALWVMTRDVTDIMSPCAAQAVTTTTTTDGDQDHVRHRR